MIDKNTHDLLIEELRKYFEAHQQFEIKKTHVAATAARAHLSEIRRLATIRRDEIQQIRKTKSKKDNPGTPYLEQARKVSLENRSKK